MNLTEINQRFGIPGSLQVVEGAGGLPAIDITSPHGTGRVYLHGAHIASWTPTDPANAERRDVLFLSRKAKFLANTPIRGGIPVIFPWFGPPPATGPETPWSTPTHPMHGLVRTRPWEIEATRLGDGKVAFVLLFKSSAETKALWPFDFELRMRLTFGPQLIIKMEAKNTGSVPFHFQEALHTYFAVGDVRQTRVSGLENLDFHDQMAALQIKHEGSDPAGPEIKQQIDRIYLKTPPRLTINDPVGRRRIVLETQEAGNAVLWNPGTDKILTFADMSPEEWTAMLCLESGNIRPLPAVTLAPGAIHQMRLTLGVGKIA
ncbi:MAG: D-hexose-6-phosphate mutarotase [Phycisphaerae bacterium]